MRIFIIEYITGGGLIGEDLPPSLAHEGDLMLTSLATDLCAIEGVDVIISRDPRLAWTVSHGSLSLHRPGPDGDIWEFWEKNMADVDALWPIAPETGGVLERLSRLCLANNITLLGSEPETVALLSSKSGTTERLVDAGIETIPCFRAAENAPLFPGGYVVKPDDGAGAVDTFFFQNKTELQIWREGMEDLSPFILQPFISGTSASLSALFAQGQSRLLSCNRANGAFGADGFEYSGFDVGAMEEYRAPFAALAKNIAAAFPGLWGYAGVDVLLQGEKIYVVEVNPRLTTCYTGLSKATGENPARQVLSLLEGSTDSLDEKTAPPCPVMSPVTVGRPFREVAHG